MYIKKVHEIDEKIMGGNKEIVWDEKGIAAVKEFERFLDKVVQIEEEARLQKREKLYRLSTRKLGWLKSPWRSRKKQ